MYEGERRRYRGIPRSYYSDLKSIVLIAVEYDLDPKRLIDTFLEALENNFSQIKNLQVSCRSIRKNSATFLITKGDKVVWQFPINLEIIRNPELRYSITEVPIEKKVKSNEPLQILDISQLRFGMTGINVIGEILEIPAPKQVTTRWGSLVSVSNIKIADKTGSIRLSLWNEQIKMFNVGDTVKINNCSVSRFGNEPQLTEKFQH